MTWVGSASVHGSARTASSSCGRATSCQIFFFSCRRRGSLGAHARALAPSTALPRRSHARAWTDDMAARERERLRQAELESDRLREELDCREPPGARARRAGERRGAMEGARESRERPREVGSDPHRRSGGTSVTRDIPPARTGAGRGGWGRRALPLTPGSNPPGEPLVVIPPNVASRHRVDPRPSLVILAGGHLERDAQDPEARHRASRAGAQPPAQTPSPAPFIELLPAHVPATTRRESNRRIQPPRGAVIAGTPGGRGRRRGPDPIGRDRDA